MEEAKLEVGAFCYLVKTSYGESVEPDITLDYTEHSSDCWHSDTETSIDLNEEKAREIIAFLQSAFDI